MNKSDHSRLLSVFNRLALKQKKRVQPSTAQARASGRTPAIQRFAMEPRMLFDAAIGATIDAIEPDTAEPSSPESVATATQQAPVDDPRVESAEPVEVQPVTAFVFIDSRISDPSAIIEAAPEHARIIQIDRNEPGLAQVQAALEGSESIDAIHLVSHGEAGRLYLGSSVLSEATIAGPYQQSLQTIGAHLTDDADLLVYGCNFAEGEAGLAAVQALSEATGADVAASDDVTGTSQLGGDWVLETHAGEIETQAIEAFEFNKVLAPITISVTNTPIVSNPPGTTTQPASAFAGHTGVRVMPGTSSVIGASARWNNAGLLGNQQLDVVATVIDADADDFVQFSSPTNPTATNDDPQLLVGDNSRVGGLADTDTVVTLRWELFLAGTNTPAAGDFAYLITDIDGTGGNVDSREAVAASVNDPVSYTIRNPSDLVGSIQGDLLRVDGTLDSADSNNSLAWVRFNWVDASTFELTYYLIASNGITYQAGFSHDGDGDKTFTNSTTASIPKLDLDLSAAGNDYATSFTENGAPVSIADADITISNNPGDLQGATITLTNRQAGDVLSVGSLPAGITSSIDTSNPAQIVVALSGTASPADYETAIQSISFSNTSDAPDLTDRIVNAQVYNALTAGTNSQAVITINPVNDAPVNALPASQTLAEDTSLIFSSANGNAISVSDIDAQGGDLTITLTVPQGSLGLAGSAGLTVTGNNSSQIVMTGTEADLNTALDGLTYTPALNQNGAIALNVATSDNGNSGTGNVLTAVGNVTINLTPVNDSPLAVDDSQSTTEDGPLTWDPRLNDGDVDGDALTITAIDGVAISTGATVPVSNGSVTLLADGSLRFTPAADYNGPSSFTYTVDDGNGGTSTATVNMTVSSVNDAPVAVDDTQSTTEDNSVTFEARSNDTDVDGDALTVTQINGTAISVGSPVPVADGQVEILADGRLMFTPTPDFNGTASFDYTVTDGNGASAIATIDVNVSPVNDAPVATDDAISTPEDNAVVFDVRTNDSDVDDDGLTVTAIDGSPISVGSPVSIAGGQIALLADGRLSFTPDPDANGSFAFSYTVDDGAGGSASANTTVTVSPQNDAPVAVADSASTAEDNALLIDVLANDSDIDGDTLTITALDGTAISTGSTVSVSDGSVTLQADGRLLFTPNPDFNGNASFSYTISDGNGATTSANTTVTVTPVNDAPVASDDNTTITEDIPAVFDPRSNDTDVDGDTLSITAVNGTAVTTGSTVAIANASVELLADGTLRLLSAPDFNGSTAFTYQISDGAGGLATATVNLTVNPANDAPVAGDDAVATDEDTAIDVDPRSNDSDLDGDPLSISAVDGQPLTIGNPVAVSNGNVVLLADGSLRFSPAPDFTGNTGFVYTLDDGAGGTDTATLSVTVNPINDAPAPADDSATANEDQAVEIDVLANDVDVDGDSISVTAVDGQPISTGASVAVADGSVTLLANGNLSFTPNLDFNGPASFTYTVTDSQSATGSAQVSLNITPVNDAPVVTNDSISTSEDQPVNIDPLGNDNDPDGDPLTVSAINGTPISIGNPVAVTGGSVALLPDGSLTFTPAADYNGPASFSYTANDGNGGTAGGSVAVNISAVNDAPVAGDDTATTDEDIATAIDVTANDLDVDGDALTPSQINGTAISVGSTVAVANGNVTLLADGRLSFAPSAEFSGTTSFAYTVADGAGLSDTANVSVTVNPVNDPPLAGDDAFGGNEDTALLFDPRGNDSDIDGDPLTVSAINGTALTTGIPVAITGGSITRLADGSLRFDPAGNLNGPVSFVYTVSDGQGGSSDATATLTIAAVNDDPVAADDSGSTSEDVAVNLPLLANDSDIDGDSLALSAIDGVPVTVGATVPVANGNVTLLADGSVTFDPNPDFNGSSSFTYTVEDGQGGSATANATVIVAPANDAPVAVDDSISTAEDSSLNFDVRLNDSDVDGDTLTISAINGTAVATGSVVATANGTLTLQPDGSLTYDPSLNFNGADSFTYTVTDGNGSDAAATVSILVSPANDSPTATNDSISTPEDTPVNFDPRLNDSDIDGDGLQITAINSAAVTVGTPTNVAGGTVTLQADGSLEFTPDANLNGPFSFSYEISDGNGGFATGTVDLLVSAQNDAPVATDDSASTAEDTAVAVDVIANDSDIDGDSLTVSAINGSAIATGTSVTVANASVTLQADGRLLVTPDPEFTGVVSFDTTVSDGNGGNATSTTLVSVNPVNDAPAANDDSVAGSEDVSVVFDVRGNDADIDDSVLTVTQINGTPISSGSPVPVANGLVSLEPDGSLRFTPAADFYGSSSFNYTVSDSSGASDVATVNLTFAPVNDAPVAVDDSTTTNEETAVSIDVRSNDLDVDSDPLTVIEIDGNPIAAGQSVPVTNGSVTLQASGELLFTPATDFTGPASFGYRISDPSGDSAVATVTVDVANLNDTPVAVDDSVATPEDQPVIIDVVGNDSDVDGDSLVVNSINGAAISIGGSVSVSNGTVSLRPDGRLDFTPAANFNGLTSFSYGLTDGNGGAATAIASITVTPVNDTPTATDDSIVTNEDTPALIDALANDSDIDGDSLTINAIDGQPVLAGQTVPVSNGNVLLQPDGSLVFTPDSDYDGPTSFAYTVTDGNGGSSTATINLTVSPVNDAPVALDDTATTAEDIPVSLDLRINDTDPDGDSLAVTQIDGLAVAVGVPVAVNQGSVTLQADGSVSFSPAGDFTGTTSFSYLVSDPDGATAVATATVTVTPANDSPLATDDSAITDEDTPVDLNPTANDSDPDGDSLQITAIDGTPVLPGETVPVSNGSATLLANGSIRFSPAADFHGSSSLAYTVSDGNGGTASANASVTVNPINDAPAAADDSFSLNEDSTLTIDVRANDSDVDGDPLVVSTVDGTPLSIGTPVTITSGSISLQADGRLLFTPAANFNGVSAFDYQISDGNGGTATAQVDLLVNAQNDAPLAQADTVVTTEDSPVNLDPRSNDSDIDGDALTISAINGSAITAGSTVSVANGTVTLETDGTLTFSPTSQFNGPATFDYTISDGSGGQAGATVTVQVDPVNDAPNATDDSISGTEDTTLVFDVRVNDTDIDGDPLQVSQINGTPIDQFNPVVLADGTVSLRSDGQLSFTPNPDFNGSTSFSYTVTDPDGLSATANASLTIVGVNDAPVAVDDTFTTTEDTPLDLDVRGNDGDIDGDPLGVAAIEGTPLTVGQTVPVTGGQVTLLASGLLRFTPDTDFNGTAGFGYTIADGNGGQSNANVTVQVVPSNDAPVAVDDNLTTAEDTPVTVDLRLNDSDIDGDSLAVTQIDGSPLIAGTPVATVDGSVTLESDGRVTFTPAGDFNGSTSFAYTVSDGAGGTANATASVIISPVNDAPVAAADTLVTNEDTPVTLNLTGNDSDIEGDSLTVSAINGSAIAPGGSVTVTNGTVNMLADGSLILTPAADYVGPVNFTYTVDDGNGGQASASVTVDVISVNDSPFASDDSAATAEDTPVAFDVRSNDGDIDGDSLLVSAINGTPVTTGSVITVADGQVRLLADGRLQFEPASDFNGSSSFVYEVTDGNGGTASATVAVTVTPVNDAPVAVGDTVAASEDSPVSFDPRLNDSDPENDPLSITRINGTLVSVGNPVPVADGSVTLLADGSLSFQPANDFNGSTSFSYTVVDSSGASAIAGITMNVTPVNDLPVAVADSASTAEDTAIDIDVLANDGDPDGDALTVTAVNGTPLTTGMSTAVSNGVVTLQPSGQLGFAPAVDFAGTTSFGYTVSDGAGGSTNTTVTVSIAAVNDAPVAVDDNASTNEDTPVVFDPRLNDSDPEGDALSIDQINGAPVSVGVPMAVAGGEVTLQADGRLQFTPTANQNGGSSFSYRISDGQGAFASATINLTINPVNDGPIAADDSFLTDEDVAVNLELRGNDTDPESDALSVSHINGVPVSVGVPALVGDGTVTLLANGTLDFQPDPDFAGTSNFAYTVSDGNGGQASANVTVLVAGVNDAPVATDDSASTLEEVPVILDVTANDVDPDGDPLAVSMIDGQVIATGQTAIVANGQVTLMADGSLRFTPDTDYNGVTSFAVQVSDGNGGTASATATVTVQPVADAPMAVDDNATGTEDTVLNLDPRGNDSDPDGDTLAIEQINGLPIAVGSPVTVADGTVALLADGSLTFTPDPDFNGSSSFTYQVTDGGLSSNAATVNLQITPANDTPIAADDAASTAEDTAVTVAVLGNDSDIDGDALSLISVNGAPISIGSPVSVANGTVSLNVSGELTFAPASDFNGATSFVYGVSDGSGGNDSATVTLTVTPVNDPPIAIDDSASGNEDIPLNLDVRSNDSDIDGDPLQVATINGVAISIGSPVAVSNGSVALAADGSLVFTPAGNFHGPTSFAYTITDSQGASTGATVNLVIANSNDAPLAVDDTATTDEDLPVEIDVLGNDSDIDADALSVTEINGVPVTVGAPVVVSNGTVTLLPNGRLSFSPTANFNGTSGFNYTVSDGNGGTAQASTAITVNPVNDAPVALDDSFTTAEDTSLLIDPRGNDSDIDGDPLNLVTIDGTPISTGQTLAVANGSVSLQPDGRLLFTPAADFNGVTTFGYQAGDGSLNSPAATVSITVTAVNDTPLAADDLASGTEDTPLLIDALANDSDPDGDALQVVTVNGQPISVGSPVSVANGQVSLLADGSLRFDPAANYHGPASFDYAIDDGNGASDSATVSLNFAPVNDAPVAGDDTLVTAQDTPRLIEVRNNDLDPDGDALSVTMIDGVAVTTGSSVSISNGSVTVQTDGGLRFDPAPGFQGTTSFSYVLTDGSADSNTANVAVTVTPPNNAPVASDDVIASLEDTDAIFDPRLNDSDPDADPISIRSVDGTVLSVGVAIPVSDGSVTLQADGSLRFTPTADFFGSTSFSYELVDSFGASDSAGITLNIANVDDGVLAVTDSVNLAEDTPATLDPRTNDVDVDNDSLAVTEINGTPITLGTPVVVADGLVTLEPDGRLTFTPDANFNGTTSFLYTLDDGNGNTSSATINLQVSAVNDSPAAQPDTLTTAEDTNLVFDVRSNDSDPEGDAFSVTQIDGVAISPGSPVAVSNGIVALLADGRLDFTPAADFNGAVSFSYQVADAAGASAISTVTVNVTPVNDAPLAQNDALTTPEDTALPLDVRFNDSDPDGDSLTVVSINGTPVVPGTTVALSNGQVTLQADGSQVFDPTPGFNGTATFNYVIEDSSGVAAGATASINVTPVNDAPVATADTASTVEDTSMILDLRANDADPDGDPLTVVQINGTALSSGVALTVTDGQVTRLADGTISFTPDADFNGTTSFTYTVSDPADATAANTATIVVTPANDSPLATPDSFVTDEELAVTIDPRDNDIDIDGDSLQIVSINSVTPALNVPLAVADGTVELLVDGRLRFVPTSDFHGTTGFAYTVGDGSGLTANANVIMVVNPVNDLPVSVDDTALTSEDTPIQIDVLANDTDPDGDPLQIASINGSSLSVGSPVSVANGMVSLTAGGQVLFTPASNFNGPTSFDYSVSDPAGMTSTATVNLVVNPVNDGPDAINDSVTTPEDTAVEFPITGNDSDPENDALTIASLNGQPVVAGDTIELPEGRATLLANGNIRFVPAQDFHGQVSLSYVVRDSAGATGNAAINVTILPLNDAPFAVDDVYEGVSGAVLVIDPRLNDIDADHPASPGRLTIVSIDGQTLLPGTSIALADAEVRLLDDGTLQVTSLNQADHTLSFSYQITDDQNLSASARVTVHLSRFAPPTLSGETGPDEITPIDSSAFKFDPPGAVERGNDGPLYVGRAVRESQAQTDLSIISNRENIVAGDTDRFAWNTTSVDRAATQDLPSVVRFAQVRSDRVFGPSNINPIAAYEPGNHNLACWADDTPQSVLALNRLLSEDEQSKMAHEDKPDDRTAPDPLLCLPGEQASQTGAKPSPACEQVSDLTTPATFTRFTEQLARARHS